MGIPSQKLGRRSVIKALGSGATGLLTVGNVSANNGAKRQGVAYNPVTHEILGEASAQLNPVHDELRGTLQIGSKKIKLNSSSPLSRSTTPIGTEKVKYKQTTNKTERGMDETVTVLGTESGGLTGYVRGNTGERVAFALTDKQGKIPLERCIQHVRNTGRMNGGEY